MAYNSDLYANHLEAESSPRGLAVVAVFIAVGASFIAFAYSTAMLCQLANKNAIRESYYSL